MPLWLLIFAFGFAAGYVLFTLERRKRLFGWERRVVRPLGWLLMSASILLALALLLGAAAGWL